MKTYWIITYGCQMNKSDSERIAAVLENQGYKPAVSEDEADLIVVNMCSVRQSAVDRVFGLTPKFDKLRIQNPNLKTILTGCVLKRDRPKFTKIFDRILKFKDLLKYQPKYQNKPLTFVPISNGCNNFCAYCVVPFARGPLICRDHKEILREVESAVEKGLNPIRNAISNGAREIWLLGQNVNDYCSRINTNMATNFTNIRNIGAQMSENSREINFAKLLKMVNDIPGDFSIRFTSPHPANFTNELINAIAQCQKVAKLLNLPVQSGDDEILKKMNRPYTVKQYKNLVKKIREKIPDVNLSTDVIVGFPGETEKQFENTVKLFKEIKFNLAYVARYSPRPGTAAFKMKDNVSLKEKKQREKILREVLEKQKGR